MLPANQIGLLDRHCSFQQRSSRQLDTGTSKHCESCLPFFFDKQIVYFDDVNRYSNRHVTPLSQTGKLFCLLYAMIGIPLTLVLLSAAVERLMTPVNWLLGALNSRLGHLYQPFNIRILHLIIVICIVLILFFGIPVAIFTHMEEDWTALDAFYYCFISLTTIGNDIFI